MFFDPSGKRWRRTIAGLVLVLLAVAGAVVWIAPQAMDTAWEQPLNQAQGYPRDLLATTDLEEIPLVGEETGFTFARIVLVERIDGKTYLADPFSDTVFRPATEEEVEEIGDSPYAMERFGDMPDKVLMFTFDDGPDPTFTPQILDVLSAEGVPATFFVLGENIVKYPQIFQRMVREGHMVGNHTMSHINFWDEGNVRNREELIATDRTMRSLAGYSSRLFRIPTGDPDNNALAVLQAQQLGYLHVDMDLDTLDWAHVPGEPIEVPELDGEGHIVLLHDGGGDRSATVGLLKELVAEAKAQGYTFATLAPVLPPGYVPSTTGEPVVADHATTAVLTSMLVVPDIIIRWLFWMGAGSVALMSALYIVLALVADRRQRRRTWPGLPEEDLPFVSVVLPVFNEAPVVARTLAALQSSDYPAMEVVAVDDGSTDDTLRILRDVARDWPKLRVLTQPNAGKSAASNAGIAAARGDIIVTLDGDTLFEPTTVRMFARHFYDQEARREIGAVAGHVKVGNRRNLLTAWQSMEYISGICVTRMAEGLVGAISIVPGACAAWRKDVLVKAGGYSHDTLAEDADLTLSIQRMGYRIVQENAAVAWTEAPMTVQGLAKQRLRWTFGNLQALRKHAGMILRPQYGALGMVALPNSLLSIVVPLLFLPLTVVMAVFSLFSGDWQSIVYFALFIVAIQSVTCVIAIVMVRESPWHLLVVPVYRLIYEPLRAYLLYGALIQALRGRAVGWYKPERTNSVADHQHEPSEPHEGSTRAASPV